MSQKSHRISLDAARVRLRDGTPAEIIYTADENNPTVRARARIHGEIIEWDAHYHEFAQYGLGRRFWGQMHNSPGPRPTGETVRSPLSLSRPMGPRGFRAAP